jgi:hypothetical protein
MLHFPRNICRWHGGTAAHASVSRVGLSRLLAVLQRRHASPAASPPQLPAARRGSAPQAAAGIARPKNAPAWASPLRPGILSGRSGVCCFELSLLGLSGRPIIVQQNLTHRGRPPVAVPSAACHPYRVSSCRLAIISRHRLVRAQRGCCGFVASRRLDDEADQPVRAPVHGSPQRRADSRGAVSSPDRIRTLRRIPGRLEKAT